LNRANHVSPRHSGFFRVRLDILSLLSVAKPGTRSSVCSPSASRVPPPSRARLESAALSLVSQATRTARRGHPTPLAPRVLAFHNPRLVHRQVFLTRSFVRAHVAFPADCREVADVVCSSLAEGVDMVDRRAKLVEQWSEVSPPIERGLRQACRSPKGGPADTVNAPPS
jgi:hypothetical protein